jgi:hypothetical protein
MGARCTLQKYDRAMLRFLPLSPRSGPASSQRPTGAHRSKPPRYECLDQEHHGTMRAPHREGAHGVIPISHWYREETSAQVSLDGRRRLMRPRRGSGISSLGPSARSSSLSVAGAACCNRRQSATGTSTAASAPRFVTICGPSRKQVSRSSLNRAFASCTGQVFIVAPIGLVRKLVRKCPLSSG